jgi:hypothetical protein
MRRHFVKSLIGWVDRQGITWACTKSHIGCVLGRTGIYKLFHVAPMMTTLSRLFRYHTDVAALP